MKTGKESTLRAIAREIARLETQIDRAKTHRQIVNSLGVSGAVTEYRRWRDAGSPFDARKAAGTVVQVKGRLAVVDYGGDAGKRVVDIDDLILLPDPSGQPADITHSDLVEAAS